MKRGLLVLVIGLIFCYQADAKKLKGYYISKSMDTMRVDFEIPIKLFFQEPNYEKLQLGVEYYVNSDETEMLFPSQAREIAFDYSGQKIRMISCEGNAVMFPEFIFLQLVRDGKLRLFKYYSKEERQSAGTIMPGVGFASGGGFVGGGSYKALVENYIFKKNNSAFFESKDKSWLLKKDTFENDMLSYFDDCLYVLHKIKVHQYGREDIPLMVDEYNMYCGK